MANVTFEEDTAGDAVRGKAQSSSTKPKGIIAFLIDKKIVQDAGSANIFLFVLAFALFILAGYIFYGLTHKEQAPIPNVRNIPFNEV